MDQPEFNGAITSLELLGSVVFPQMIQGKRWLR